MFPTRQVKSWVAWFKTGYFSTEINHPGSPFVFTLPEYVVAIHSIILPDQRISAKNITKTGNILRMWRVYHLWCVGHETLCQICAKCLNVDQKLVSEWWRKLSRGVFVSAGHRLLTHTGTVTQQKLPDLHFGVPQPLAYSPHLATCDYHLLPDFNDMGRECSFKALRLTYLL